MIDKIASIFLWKYCGYNLQNVWNYYCEYWEIL